MNKELKQKRVNMPVTNKLKEELLIFKEKSDALRIKAMGLKDNSIYICGIYFHPFMKVNVLNEEELDEFKDLIVDSQVFTSKNYDSSLKNKDAKIIELLGEQDYEVYEEYNETLVHRMKIMQYKQQLALSDSTLSEEQETDLLNIMLEEGSDKNTLEESREFLDTEQIEVLEKFQNTISNTDEMSMESLPEY